MGKTVYKKLKGSQCLRQRLILSTLASSPLLIEDIRAEDTWPGLRPHEVSLLRLLEKVCDDCVVEINETGTKLRYKPGTVMGGKNIVHDCGVSRSIGYFLEPLILVALFGKKPLSIRLKESRGAPPHGGGEVILTVPTVEKLMAVNWLDEGMLRGLEALPSLPECLLNVHIFTDHKAGPQAGKSPGYGISLVAETTSGCFILLIVQFLMHKEKLIEQGGVVDSTHQGLLFLLCALSEPDVSKIRVGKLSAYGIETLRSIIDFLSVKFDIKPDPSTGTVILRGMGCGYKNLSRKAS
ncbi:hypothetical protein LWI28_006558 [Acer negundo]|uniref:RNA 3'-terminal phosphate cyclase-like protein n=1 Tax=Acer negundo TaxID=4023 RepID=A0AAD5P0V8_ACENE|nr:hypothetical protein LWI28_006558 [Acer negundo]